jgi:hypothetical protein
MKKGWILVFVFLPITIFAEPCKIKMPDLSSALKATNGADVISVRGLTDTYSNEPIRRYIQAWPVGVIAIIEQKHCEIYNLTVTLLLPEGEPIDHLHDQFSKILRQTDIWQEWFKSQDPSKIFKHEFGSKRFLAHIGQLGSYSYAMDDQIMCKDENSEALLRVVNLEAGSLPFKRIVSFSLSVGGL